VVGSCALRRRNADFQDTSRKALAETRTERATSKLYSLQSLRQSRVSLGDLVVPHGDRYRFLRPDQHHQLLRPRDRRINQITL
jgi:hypothetical protein